MNPRTLLLSSCFLYSLVEALLILCTVPFVVAVLITTENYVLPCWTAHRQNYLFPSEGVPIFLAGA